MRPKIDRKGPQSEDQVVQNKKMTQFVSPTMEELALPDNHWVHMDKCTETSGENNLSFSQKVKKCKEDFITG